MKKAPILVSACLAGVRCRFDGKATPNEAIQHLVSTGRAIPFCPEVYGGLPTPRPPCELQGSRAMGRDGKDYTPAFFRGAEEGVRIAKLAGCEEAVLKANSPSCGSGTIYDGTFTSTQVQGNGIFAALLTAHGIIVRTEDDLDRS